MKLLVVLVLLAGFVQLASADESDDLLALLLKVRLSMERFEDEQTQAFLEQAERLAPDSPDVQSLKLDWLVRHAQRDGSEISWSDVRAFFESVLISFPEDYRFFKELGVLLVREPAFARNSSFLPAETYLQRSLELMDSEDNALNPDRAEAHFCLGQAHMGKKKFFDAASAFGYVCHVIPEMAWAWYHAAQAYDRSGQLRTALRYYQTFQSKMRFVPPQTSRSLVLSVSLLQAILEPTQTHIENLCHVLQGLPNQLAQRENVVSQLCHAGRFEAALQVLRRLTNDEDMPTALVFREFQCHMALQQYQEASARLMFFQSRAKDDRLRQQFLELALEAALMAGKYSATAKKLGAMGSSGESTARGAMLKAAFFVLAKQDTTYWDRTILRHQQSPLIMNYRQHAEYFGIPKAFHLLVARLYLANQDYDSAILRYRNLGSWKSLDPALKLELADTLALAGHVDEAFRLYDALLADDPKQADTLNNYGFFLAREDRQLEKARQLIERSLALDPHCGACMDSLGWVFFRLKDLDRAEKYLKKALNESPLDVEKLEHLGDVYTAQGRIQDGKRAYSQALTLSDGPNGQFDRLLNKLDPP